MTNQLYEARDTLVRMALKVHQSKRILKLLDKQALMRSAEEDKLEKDLRRWFIKLQRKVQKLIEEYYEDELFFLHINKVYAIVDEMKPEYRAILLKHGLTRFYNARETTTTSYTIQQKKVSTKSSLYESKLIRQKDVGLFRTNPQIEDKLRYNIFQASDKTLNRVTENITNNLADSYHDGLGIRDAGRRITKEFARLKGWESHRIARTEINSAQNEGAFSVYDELGVEYHMWWTGKDARVRDSHKPLHGHIVAVGNTFSNGLLYPGDKSGPIKEWINCRCTTVPYIIPLGKMAPLGLTEFTEDQLVDIPGYSSIAVEGALNGEYPLEYYTEEGMIEYYRMESPYRQLKNAIADELNGFIPEEDIELLSSELTKHKLQTDKLKYERISLWDNQGRKILNSYTEHMDSRVDFPETVPKNYKFSIHNHPKGHSPIPSFSDINELLYSRYSFTTTTDNGLVFMKSEMRNIDYNSFEANLNHFYDKLMDDFSRAESIYLSKLDDAVAYGRITREKAGFVENYKFQKYLSKHAERYCRDLDDVVRNYGIEVKHVPDSRIPRIDNFKQKQSFIRTDFDGNIIGRGSGAVDKKQINKGKLKFSKKELKEFNDLNSNKDNLKFRDNRKLEKYEDRLEFNRYYAKYGNKLPKNVDEAKRYMDLVKTEHISKRLGKTSDEFFKTQKINNLKVKKYIGDEDNPQNYKRFKGTRKDGMLPIGESIEVYFNKNVATTSKYDNIIDDWVYDRAYKDIQYFDEVGRDKQKLWEKLIEDNPKWMKKRIKKEYDRIISRNIEFEELMDGAVLKRNIVIHRTQRNLNMGDDLHIGARKKLSSFRSTSISVQGMNSYKGGNTNMWWKLEIYAPAGTKGVYIAPKAKYKNSKYFNPRRKREYATQMETIIGPDTEVEIWDFDVGKRTIVLKVIN